MDPGEERTYRKFLDEANKLLWPGEALLGTAYVSFGLKPGVVVLTEERIIVCHAITSAFGVRRAEVRLADVDRVEFTKGTIRDGTRNMLTIASAAGSLHPLAADETQGRRWADLAARQLQKQTGSPQPPGDLAQQLTQLADLHRQGALSDAEFEAAKAKLLN
jgi:Short C-terminal domain